MTLEVIAPPEPGTVSPGPGRKRLDVPIRPRSFHRDDLVVLALSAIAALALVVVLYEGLTIQAGIPGLVIWWFVALLVIYYVAVRRLQGRLMAFDRAMTVVIAGLTLTMLAPLVLIIGFVIYEGVSVISPHFFVNTVDMCGPLDPASCGGVGHAIVGTLEQVGLAVVLAVPLALLCAVFLNEIGGPLRRPVRIFVDAMSGVPSIVAGLFIYAVWVLGFGRGFSGFGASLALAILMLPTVTRTSEEVLRLVPDGLREGSLALGGSEWRTTWSVVLPTARSGIITASILGVARAVGETAPLILLAFGNSSMNANPFAGAQEALPHFVYEYIRYNPGTAPYQRAWGAALVLIVLVLALFTLARVIGARTSVEARQRREARRASKTRIASAATGGAGS
jgi:phosphate transport system permease protein